MKHLFGILIVCWSSAVFADTVILDFESFPDNASLATVGTENGFYIDPTGSAYSPGIHTDISDNNTLTFCGWCQAGLTNGVSVYAVSGDLFELESLDVLTVNDDGSKYFFGGVTGHLQGGGSISIVFNSESANYTFNDAWQNLSSIDIYFDMPTNNPDNWQMPGVDNIVINTVPIPAAFWLFGSALAGLGWIRRKQAV